jgi:oligoribonuclease NrnB/cAMP/cGMP phosphodiesterase (DHH superfamily)
MTTGDSPATTINAVLSISHDKDVDGLNSAAIVLRYAESKRLKHDVMLTDYGSFEQVFSKVSKYRNTLIIVTDLGMDDNVLDVIVTSLSRAISQGSRVVWLDHHQWSEKAVKAILGLPNKPVLKVNHEFCGAEIAHKVLMPRDKISEQLAIIAHDTDFNLREMKAAGALTDALSVIRFGALDRREDLTSAILPLLTDIAKGGIEGVWNEASERLKDELLWKRVENYRKERFKKMKRALAGHCDQEIHGRLVRIVEMPSGVTTTDLGTFLAVPENLEVDGTRLPVADLLITLSPGGMLGFRRGSESVLCNTAASSFSGGGHPYAAGGEYGMYSDFQAVCDDIFLTLSKTTDWTES